MTRRISHRDVVHPDARERVQSELDRFNSEPGRTEFGHDPYRIITAEGTVRWVDDHTYIRRDANGTITHHQGIVVDITEERSAADQLWSEKERLAVTLRSIGDAVITTDRDGRVAPIVDSDGEIVGVVMVFRDTTEQLRMEEELLKMEKLQSLGVLAGGIAHDFNNFLAGILGNVSVARADIPDGTRVSQSLEAMEKAALRAKDLTQQLLTFSKCGEPVRGVTDLGSLILDSTEFALRGSKIEFDLRIDSGLNHVHVEEGQIAQVFHNLMLNAVQAMPDGGTVHIRATNTTLEPGNAYALGAGRYVRLSIQDEGTGIEAADIQRVFDPYFTTKRAGSGLGLGLAVAYSIVTRHDGKLTVESEIGRGTTFVILLPAKTDAPHAKSDPQVEIKRSGGRVLIMDDERFIRTLVSRMLGRLGNETAVPASGEEAVSLYRSGLESGQRYDAVVLDLTVRGGMGGRETIGELQALDPSVRAIVSSGYSNDPIIARYADSGFYGAVQKPFRIGEIEQALAEAIGPE